MGGPCSTLEIGVSKEFAFGILSLLGASVCAQPTNNPFPDPIGFGGVAAQLSEVVAIPDSDGLPARMNLLAPAYDGSGRLFLIDQRGPMYSMNANGSGLQLYLDLRDFEDRLTGEAEGGLQSFAFHPDFESNGKFYTVHGTTNTTPTISFDESVRNLGLLVALQVVVWEWTASDPASDTYDGPPPREVIRWDQHVNTHYGCGMAFDYNAGPGDETHGLLYISTGDGTRAGDPNMLAQNAALANGKLLCINPLEGPGGEPYTIPATNPFISDPGIPDEFYALGFRNPQRLSFDPAGVVPQAILTDIGQGVIEEVNRIEPGANYGWAEREGSFGFVDRFTVEPTPTPPGFTDPICEYDHGEGFAITGGYVVRTDTLPAALQGSYLFGDIRAGRIFYLTDPGAAPIGSGQDVIRELALQDKNMSPTTLLDVLGDENRADLRFGIGEDNRIYVLNKRDGMLRRLRFGPCNPADVAVPYGLLDLLDVQSFLIGFAGSDPVADVVPDSMFDLQDVQTFLSSFGDGCP